MVPGRKFEKNILQIERSGKFNPFMHMYSKLGIGTNKAMLP